MPGLWPHPQPGSTDRRGPSGSPAAAIERATGLVRDAGLLLVIGSSLQAWPVAELPALAQGNGATVAIVNAGPTTFDGECDLRIEADAAATLEALAIALLGPAAPSA